MALTDIRIDNFLDLLSSIHAWDFDILKVAMISIKLSIRISVISLIFNMRHPVVKGCIFKKAYSTIKEQDQNNCWNLAFVIFSASLSYLPFVFYLIVCFSPQHVSNLSLHLTYSLLYKILHTVLSQTEFVSQYFN